MNLGICRTGTYIYPAIDWPANWHLKVPRVESQNLLFVFAPLFYWQTFLLLRIIFIRFALFINEMSTHWRICLVNVEHDIKFNCIIANWFNLCIASLLKFQVLRRGKVHLDCSWEKVLNFVWYEERPFKKDITYFFYVVYLHFICVHKLYSKRFCL